MALYAIVNKPPRDFTILCFKNLSVFEERTQHATKVFVFCRTANYATAKWIVASFVARVVIVSSFTCRKSRTEANVAGSLVITGAILVTRLALITGRLIILQKRYTQCSLRSSQRKYQSRFANLISQGLLARKIFKLPSLFIAPTKETINETISLP